MIAPRPLEGIRTHLLSTVPTLEREGCEVTLVVSEEFSDLVKGFKVIKLKSLQFPVELLTHYSVMPSLAGRVFRRFGESCDLIHIHGYTHFPSDFVCLTKAVHQIPIVITFHGTFNSFVDRSNYVYKAIHNSIMVKFQNRVSRYIAVSSAERRLLLEAGIAQDRVDVVYNGVHPKYLAMARARTIHEPTAPKYMLYVGRLSPSKNLSMLLRAAAAVIQKRQDVYLVLAGPDWGETRTLQRLAEKLGIASRVIFTGVLSEEEKMRIMRSSFIYIHPSIQDIFSLSVIEASATGVPVICFDLFGNPEMVIDGQTGLLVKEISSEALAVAMMVLLDNEAEAHQMGQNGHDFVSRAFRWESTARAMNDIYRHVSSQA